MRNIDSKSRPRTQFRFKIPCCSDSIVAFGRIADDFFNSIGQKQTFRSAIAMSALPPKATLIAFFGMSAMGHKRTSPALFCALNNALRATDQIDPNFAHPPVVDKTGLVAERLDFRGREVGHLHLIHLLKD